MQLILPHLGFLSFLGPNQCLDEYSKPEIYGTKNTKTLGAQVWNYFGR